METASAVATEAFRFYECILMVRPLGIKALNLREFLFALKNVDGDCIHHHFHQSYLKHQFDIADYPNDFAQWAALQLEDAALGEKLGNLNPYHFEGLEALKENLAETVEDHLFDAPFIPSAKPGMEFHFCTDTLLVSDTGKEARTLAQFRQALEHVDNSCIYYHFYESRFRLPGIHSDDFSNFFEKALNLRDLAQAVRSMEIYFTSLKEVRAGLVDLVDAELKRQTKEVVP
ncbi:MAG TPA: DUF5752 family protein [bacterium]|nr:DUF5752 family protein [bacterium]